MSYHVYFRLQATLFYKRCRDSMTEHRQQNTWVRAKGINPATGGPVAKTLYFQCKGHGFYPQSDNQIPHTATKSPCATAKRSHMKQRRWTIPCAITKIHWSQINTFFKRNRSHMESSFFFSVTIGKTCRGSHITLQRSKRFDAYCKAIILQLKINK